MVVTYIHTCYRILEPEKSKDFYVNKLSMKKLGEMDLGSATNHFFAMEEDASSPMLELTHNHDRTEPYDKGDGYAHVAFTVDDLEGTVATLKEQGVTVTLEPAASPLPSGVFTPQRSNISSCSCQSRHKQVASS
jgi:lactoylglutathione lyase